MNQSAMQKRPTGLAKILMFTALFFGVVPLTLLGLFLFFGPFNLVVIDASLPVALAVDATLCMLFFIQHSGMIRRSFQAWLGRYVADYLHGAIFTVASGVSLLALLLFWQPTVPILFSAAGILRLVLRSCFVAGIGGFVWGARALGAFDAFGIRAIKQHLCGKPPKRQALAVRGPYKWVRHPLYSFVLLILWCYPDLTPDRLLLNASWTVWVLLGTVLEERDLVSMFGDPYREYQKLVPMLMPWRFPKR